MKVSFIVTTYNLSEAQLRRCLLSLTHQELPPDDYEIIVVDDESDIDPQPIVESYSSVANVRYFRQEHSRQGAARNRGLREAHGEFIRFVDGDDYLFAGTTRHLLSLFDDHQADVVISAFNEVSSDAVFLPRSVVERTNSQTDIYDSHQYMASHTLFGSCCVLMFRRTLLDGEPLFFAENTYIEDEEFVTRLVWRAHTVVTTDLVTYAYTHNPSSTTHLRDEEHVNDLFSARFNALGKVSHLAHEAEGDNKGLNRKAHFLAVDILRLALREPDWKSRTASYVNDMRKQNLFPPVNAAYNTKYSTFTRLVTSSTGRQILRLLEKTK